MPNNHQGGLIPGIFKPKKPFSFLQIKEKIRQEEELLLVVLELNQRDLLTKYSYEGQSRSFAHLKLEAIY